MARGRGKIPHWPALICFLFLLPAAGSWAAEPAVLEVYDPTGAMEVTEVHAPRLDTLAGKTICELSNDTWQAHRVLPEVRRLLKERFPTARFIPFTEFPMGADKIDQEQTAELIVQKGCQAVITGNAG